MLRISSSLIAAAYLLAACSSNDNYDYGADGDVGDSRQLATTENPINSDGLSADQPLPGTQEELELSVGDRVFFDFDRATIRPDGEATLRRQAQFLRDNNNLSITVAGHCDERGTREYNLALGERRANAAKNFLVSLGIDASRITTTSYGKERPIVLGHNEAAWAQNRVSITSIN